MDPLDGAIPVCLDGQSLSPLMVNQTTEGIVTTQTYSTIITTSPSSSMISSRHECESEIARNTTHNGMLTVIFKASDYYKIIAAKCKLTIVGMFLKPRPQIDRFRSKLRN